MSKTLYVGFRGRGFWALDVVSGIFLKHLIDAAALCVAARREPWLSVAVEHWRFNAVVCDCGFFLDDDWSGEQVQAVRELATAACNMLSNRSAISAEEMSSWPLLDGTGVSPRGCASIAMESVIRLGQAVIQLLDGSLPEAPPGAWWFFGAEDYPRTVAKQES